MKAYISYLIFFLVTGFLPLFAGWEIEGEAKAIAGGEGVYFMNPSWSGDGNWIAFSGAQYQGLWTLSLESGSLKQISDETSAGFGYSWSENSHYIASRVARFENYRRLNAIKIFDAANDSSWIISDYQTGKKGLPNWTSSGQIYLLDDKNVAFLDTNIPGNSNPLKNDQKFSLLRQGKIALLTGQNSSLQILDPVAEQTYLNLVVSPDGQKLAFEVMGGHLYIMNIDGSSLLDLGFGYRPKWSPDGQALVYMITEDDGHAFTQSDIYIINADGSGKTRLTETIDILEMSPNWAPDGQQIVFDSYNDGVIYRAKIVER